jgi:hypothetical protein
MFLSKYINTQEIIIDNKQIIPFLLVFLNKHKIKETKKKNQPFSAKKVIPLNKLVKAPLVLCKKEFNALATFKSRSKNI